MCTSSLPVLLFVLSPLSMSSDELYYMEVYLKNAADNGFVNVKVRVYIDNGEIKPLEQVLCSECSSDCILWMVVVTICLHFFCTPINT